MQLPAVIHIAHSATLIPSDVRAELLLDDEALEAELRAMTDHETDILFGVPSDVATPVVFPVSRLVVDPERFIDEDMEVMASRGMGVIYTRTSSGRPLRKNLTSGQRAALLERFYHPHHQRLTAAVSAALSEHGRCLLIDGHSFPSIPLPYELDQDSARPDICVGTDVVHTPSWLRDLAVEIFEGSGLTVAINKPFAGAMVPAEFLGHDRNVLPIMIEVNRRMYMDESTGRRASGFEFVAAEIGRTTHELILRAGRRFYR